MRRRFLGGPGRLRGGGRVAGGARTLVAAMLLIGLSACGGPQEFSPTGDIPSLPAEFRWPDTAAADAYVLQVFAPDGAVLFESDRLERARFPVDDALRGTLQEAVRFEWRVRIYDGSRIAGHSDRHPVTLTG